MALLGSATGVVKGVVELPIDIVKSFGREPVYRAEEDGPKNFVARLPNNAQRSSSPIISDALPYQPGNYPASVEATQYSAHARNGTHDLASPTFRDKEMYPFDVQGDVGNAIFNQRHPREPQEHPSNVSRSYLSASSSKFLTLTTVQALGRMVKTTCAVPLAFTLRMTQGFRNAPALYGDTTVRPATDVTGWQSGIRTAGKEFALGMYDGISGVLTQPYHGAKKEEGPRICERGGEGIRGYHRQARCR